MTYLQTICEKCHALSPDGQWEILLEDVPLYLRRILCPQPLSMNTSILVHITCSSQKHSRIEIILAEQRLRKGEYLIQNSVLIVAGM